MSAAYDREWATRSAAQVRGSGTWRRGPCEACPHRVGKDDRKPKFAFNTATGGFSCLRCGFKGRLRPHELDALGLAVAEREAAHGATGPAVIAPPEFFAPLYEGAGWHSPAYDWAHAYLAGRGLDAQLIADAAIGACAEGAFRGRVVVPILAPHDPETWFGFSSRATWPRAQLPYRYPTGMDRERIVYNHDALLVETDEPAIVVEGVFDALAYWPDGVAVLGKVSEGQMDALLAARRPVCVVLDGDAWCEGAALAWRLQFDGARAGWVKLPPCVDPDELPRDALRAAARASIGKVDAVEL